MALETGLYVNSLVATNPVKATDVISEGADHLQLIKSTIKNTFPNISGGITATNGDLSRSAIYTTGGSSAAYTVTTNPTTGFSLSAGYGATVKFHTAPSASATLNINSTGAKSLATPDGFAIAASGLSTTSYYTVIYDGTNYVVSNATPSALSAGSLTISGTSAHTGAATFSSTASIAGITTITNATSSSLYSNGALVITGGLGVGGSINSNGIVYGANGVTSGASLFSTTYCSVGSYLTVAAATASTNTTTGAAIITGGVGIGGNLNVGGNFGLTGTSSHTGAATFSSTAAISGITTISNSTASTTTSTGALVVTGGVGIGGAVNAAGDTKLTSATASTTTSTGALVVTGGVGIGGDVFITGNVTSNGKLVPVNPNTTYGNSYTIPKFVGSFNFISGTAYTWSGSNVNGTAPTMTVNSTGNFTWTFPGITTIYSINAMSFDSASYGLLLGLQSGAPTNTVTIKCVTTAGGGSNPDNRIMVTVWGN